MKPAEPAPYQIAKDRLTAIPTEIVLDPGAGVGRVIEAGKGKARLSDLTVRGPARYGAGDDYSAIATLTGDGNGYSATRVTVGGLHVAFRCCDYDRQDVCLQDCRVHGHSIGNTQDWVFGVLGRTAGRLTIGGGLFSGGGSHTKPNKSHRIYIGRECSVGIDGTRFRENWCGREIQCYDGTPEEVKAWLAAGHKFRKPEYWHVRKVRIERLLLPAGQLGSYHAIESNPLVTSEFEDCWIHNDYCCINAQGDVVVRGGVLEGKGAGIRAMRSGIRIELHGVENRCAIPVDKQGFDVKVVRS